MKPILLVVAPLLDKTGGIVVTLRTLAPLHVRCRKVRFAVGDSRDATVTLVETS